MNQIKSEFSKSIDTKDNLFYITRNFENTGNPTEPESLGADENVLRVLDQRSPGWNCEIVDFRAVGNMLLITAAITIDGVTRHGIGTAALSSADEIHRAERSALLCAAKKFSFVREELVSGRSGLIHKSSSLNYPANPMAQNLFDLITAKQISMITRTSEALKLDAETECQKILGCGVGELSRKAAASFIAHLAEIQEASAIAVETDLRRAG